MCMCVCVCVCFVVVVVVVLYVYTRVGPRPSIVSSEGRFVECAGFDSGETSGRSQSLASRVTVSHPCGGDHARSVGLLTFGFPEECSRFFATRSPLTDEDAYHLPKD